jgi:hypothetical protein
MRVFSLHVAGKMKLELNKLPIDWFLGEGVANRNKRDGLIVVREVCEA